MNWHKLLQMIAGLIVIAMLILLVIQNWEEIRSLWSGETTDTINIYVDDQAFSVTIADSKNERIQGLSGVKNLPEFAGKLFIFPEAARHGMWMRDMNFPIDILWFDNDLRLIHIEKSVQPDTYPTIFAPPQPARFVLEVNAGIADTLNIFIGDRLTIPPNITPQDIIDNLQL